VASRKQGRAAPQRSGESGGRVSGRGAKHCPHYKSWEEGHPAQGREPHVGTMPIMVEIYTRYRET